MDSTATPDAALFAQLMQGKNLPPVMATYPLAYIPDATERLKNVAVAAGAESLGDFLRLGRDHRFRLRNYGRLSEANLERIVLQFWRKHPTPPPPSDEKNSASAGPPFESLYAHPKPWTMISETVWKNWQKALATMPDRPISDVALQLGLWWPDNARTATLKTYAGISLREQSNLPAFGSVKRRTVVLVIAYTATHGEAEELKRLDDVLALPLLQKLSPREKLILDERLLVPSVRQTTLEDMGQSAGVTRERIRQLEAGILGRLRDSRHGPRIGQLLHENKAAIFERLAGGELGLTDARFALAEREFGGTELLAIQMLGISLRQWVDQTFIRESAGWFGGSEEEWGTIKRRLQSWGSEHLPLPEAAVAGSSNVTVREARAYFQLTGRAIVFEGYLLDQDSAMSRRAARLHAFLAAEGQQGAEPTRVAEACGRAMGRANAEDHARNGYRAILHTPTLFLASPAAVVPLGPGAPWRHNCPETEATNETAETSPSESLIAEIVRRHGPISSSALIDVCREDERLGLARSSVAVMVSRSMGFERLAPGLYDVRELCSLADRVERARESLMNERDVRRYSIARYSGEDLPQLFPLWDLEQEKRWAIWGRQALPSDLWGSLMWVAAPQLWPHERGQRPAEWLDWKEQGRWRLRVSWQDDLPEHLPALRDVLLVARCAQLVGHMTWIRANHLLAASHVHERTGLISIVLGVILGLLDPQAKNRWGRQTPHTNFDREWIEFENLLLLEPAAGWSHPALTARFNRASLRAAAGELGWVTVNEVSLLRRLTTAEVISTREEVEDSLPVALAVDDDEIKI